MVGPEILVDQEPAEIAIITGNIQIKVVFLIIKNFEQRELKLQ